MPCIPALLRTADFVLRSQFAIASIEYPASARMRNARMSCDDQDLQCDLVMGWTRPHVMPQLIKSTRCEPGTGLGLTVFFPSSICLQPVSPGAAREPPSAAARRAFRCRGE